jgi:hypothetical protein
MASNDTIQLVELYHRYAREIKGIMDISRWCFRKTITASVLSPERTNEQKVLDAIANEDAQEGDKLSFYFDSTDQLKLLKDWRADHSEKRLLKKLYDTVMIFDTVIDKTLFKNYTLKKNQHVDFN